MPNTSPVVPAFFLLLAVVCMTTAVMIPASEYVMVLLLLAGFVLAVVGGGALLEYLLDHIGYLWLDLRSKASYQDRLLPETILIKEFAKLSDYQAEIFLKRWTTSKIYPGVGGAMMVYVVDDEEIPPAFVHEFFDNSTREYLAPIRNYGEGTKGREWAKAITDFYVKRGIAAPAAGNKPARWLRSYEEALAWFNLIEEN